jgi:hypothetical protein
MVYPLKRFLLLLFGFPAAETRGGGVFLHRAEAARPPAVAENPKLGYNEPEI